MSAIVKPSNPYQPSARQGLMMAPNTAHTNITPFPPAVRSRYERQQIAQLPTVAPLTRQPTEAVKAFPRPQSIPTWLRMLVIAQRGSLVITFVLASTVLAIYSWAVYSQQQWSRQYQRYETLQRHERELTATNEALKDHLAQQAESAGSGLVLPNASNTVFLEPATPRFNTIPTQPIAPAATLPAPLGY